MAKQERPVNPWAVCTAAVGRKNKAKYERCVRAIKARMGMRNPSVSAVWPTLKRRPREQALRFAGVEELRAFQLSRYDWSDLPSDVKGMLLKGWNMGTVGGTTRRHGTTKRRVPVMTNPASEDLKRQIMGVFRESRPGFPQLYHETTGLVTRAVGLKKSSQASVGKALMELAREGHMRGELQYEFDYTTVRGGHFGGSKIAIKRLRWRWGLADEKHPAGLYDMSKGGVKRNPTEGWAVTQDGETLKHFGPGTKGANAAFAWLHKRQGQSVDWAVQYSGYDMVNVEGGKVVYSYKRQGLRRLTNPGNGGGMEDRAREVIRKAEAALGPLTFGAKVDLLLDNLPFENSKEAAAMLMKLGYRRNGTKGAYPFKEKIAQYRQYTPAQLLFAQRDAMRAARAMKGHDPSAENWYMDDFYTISDEITRRRQSLPNRKEKGMESSLKNAAAGATKVVEAFLAGRKAREGSRPDYKAGARYETDGVNLIQWGSIIARKVNGSIEITDAGWRTKTTMAMLNAVLYRAAMNVSLYQKSHQWFLSTSDGVKPWTGKAVIKLDGGSVLANRKGRAAKMRTRQRRAAQRKGRWYVSTYEVTQEYGGPEEGGWWYSRGIPTGVYRQFKTREEANQYAMRVEAKKKERLHQLRQEAKAKGYRGWSRIGEESEDTKLVVQSHPPRRWPEFRPHYENNPKRTHKSPEKGGWVLQSANWIYAPGFLKWIMHGYATSSGKQKEKFANFVRITWGDIIPKAVSRGLAAGTIPYKIVGENVHVDAPGKGVRLNPLSRKEAADMLKMGREYLSLAHSKPHGSAPRAFWRGAAVGVGRAVDYHGPKSARRAAWKVVDRADKTRALPNPISCLKNLHTKSEQDRAIRLIHRYYLSGVNALHRRSKEKAAHAYGALAAIRRIAKMERPVAQRVANFASFRMDCLRSAAKGQGRYRTKVVL